MMRKDADLAETLSRLNSRIDEHIGSNGKSQHLPADIDRSGFMTPDQVLDLSEALGNRTWLSEGTDVLTLTAGHYAGINLVNSSYPSGDTGILLVDVAKSGDNYVQIKEWESVYGRLKTRTIHKNDNGENYSAPTGWLSNHRVGTLWTGSASTNGTVITLTETVDKFDSFYVWTSQSGAVTGHLKKLKGVDIQLNETQNYNSGPNNIEAYEMILKINDDRKSFKLSTNLNYTINGSAANTSGESPYSVVRIEGIK